MTQPLTESRAQCRAPQFHRRARGPRTRAGLAVCSKQYIGSLCIREHLEQQHIGCLCQKTGLATSARSFLPGGKNASLVLMFSINRPHGPIVPVELRLLDPTARHVNFLQPAGLIRALSMHRMLRMRNKQTFRYVLDPNGPGLVLTTTAHSVAACCVCMPNGQCIFVLPCLLDHREQSKAIA